MSRYPTKLIGELCELQTGGTPKRSVKEYFENGTVPWLVSGDIHQKKIYECENKITESGLENSSAKILPVDSVLIALNGQGKTRGTVAMLKFPATCNQSIVCMTPKDRSIISADFIWRYLDSIYTKIRRLTGDKDRRGLNMPIIRRISIPVPPLSEQERIVRVLDEAEGLRRLRQQADQRTAQLISALFNQMFGNPATNPKGWEAESFKNTFKDITSKCEKLKKSDYQTDGLVPIIDQGQSFIAGFTDDNAIATKTSKPVVVFGDHTRAVKYVDFNFVVGADGAKVLLPSSEFNSRFAESLLKLMPIPDLGYSRHMREVKRMSFPCPPLDLQTEFANRVAEIREMEAAQAQSRARLDDAFQSLLHRAFNGEL